MNSTRYVRKNYGLQQNPYYINFILDLLITALSVGYLIVEKDQDILYISLYTINCLITIWHILDVRKKPYSLKLLVNFFIYIFFILANGIQFTQASDSEEILSFYIKFDTWDFVGFQFIIFLILILYNGAYAAYRFKKRYAHNNDISIDERKLIFISIVGTLLVLLYYNFNFFQLFLRGMSEELLKNNGIEHIVNNDNVRLLLFNQFIRPLPWACLLVALLNKECTKKVKFFLFITTLLTVFPTGLSRNQVAMYWIPIFIIFFQKWITGRRFVYTMFFGLLFIFPFLDIFRYYNGEFNFHFSLNYLNSMNFDASQILMATMKTDFITYGFQLLGVLFFFIPRTFWPGKPVGSGHLLAQSNHAGFTNVSMPFWGEGYMNFGIIGVFAFCIFLAYISKRLDWSFWNNQYSLLGKGIYLIVCGAIIFILRGDLMSSFSYTLGTCASFFFVCHFSLRKSN